MKIVCIKTSTESCRMRYYMQIYLKLPKVKNLDFQIYLIEIDFFGNFNFDFW